jgi:uncharacterized damage-inducible protein DinB
MRLRSRFALCASLLALLLAAPKARAQNPVSDALRSTLDQAHANIVGAAATMPPDKYSYKPTPAHMTFAQHVLHMADFNETMCALLSGTSAPAHAKLTDASPKEQLHDNIHNSFMYCTTALAKLTDASLGSTVSFYGSPITKAKAVLILSNDWADHYAVMATYLRLNGLLPPTAKK